MAARRWDPRWVIAPAAAALVALALLPGLHSALPSLAVSAFFARVCHQDPARSFWVAGVPVGVCARCLGVYAGAAVGAFLRLPRAVAIRFLVLALALNLFDIATEAAGLHGNWMLARAGAGALLGAAIAAVIASSFRHEGDEGIRIHSNHSEESAVS